MSTNAAGLPPQLPQDGSEHAPVGDRMGETADGQSGGDLSITFRRWLPGDPSPVWRDHTPLDCRWHFLVGVLHYRGTRRQCDCDEYAHHRWNCTATPIWAQTIRELDCNPWTVVTWPMPIAGLHGWVRTGALDDSGSRS